MEKPKDTDEYIASFPKDIQRILEQLRMTIKNGAPQAEEVISYGMPAFKLDGMLVWFASHSRHIGFYPRVSGIEAFRKELSVYKVAKGSVQFPLDKPLPLGLITEIVKFRAKENLSKVKPEKRLPRSSLRSLQQSKPSKSLTEPKHPLPLPSKPRVREQI